MCSMLGGAKAYLSICLSGRARGVSRVVQDTPDLRSATLGATKKNYMLLFHFLCLIALKKVFIFASNSRMRV